MRVPCGRVRVFYGTDTQPVYRTSGLKFLYTLPPAKKQPDNRSDCSTCFYFHASYKKATPSCTEAHLPLQHVPEPRIYNLVRNVIGNAPASKSSIPKKKRTPHLTDSCKNREFVSQSNGDPVGIRTLDLLIRSQSLYPAELPSHIFKTCLFYKIAFSLSR